MTRNASRSGDQRNSDRPYCLSWKERQDPQGRAAHGSKGAVGVCGCVLSVGSRFVPLLRRVFEALTEPELPGLPSSAAVGLLQGIAELSAEQRRVGALHVRRAPAHAAAVEAAYSDTAIARAAPPPRAAPPREPCASEASVHDGSLNQHTCAC